mmetsp:Transcript_45025/g.101928  ORF Transcript_45025/g.101928 Transcript_45025/m.101928 type:complete len:208 (+) Transcript_45025:649-1272(+)
MSMAALISFRSLFMRSWKSAFLLSTEAATHFSQNGEVEFLRSMVPEHFPHVSKIGASGTGATSLAGSPQTGMGRPCSVVSSCGPCPCISRIIFNRMSFSMSMATGVRSCTATSSLSAGRDSCCASPVMRAINCESSFSFERKLARRFSASACAALLSLVVLSCASESLRESLTCCLKKSTWRRDSQPRTWPASQTPRMQPTSSQRNS